MKKQLIIYGIALIAATTFSACGTKENKNGVLINGVYWATCDVDMPGTFTESPEDEGMCYQWGMRSPINPDSENIWNEEYKSTKWTRPDDPCPEGWRIPTMSEWASLLDLEKVSQNWTKAHGVKGMKYTDTANNNSIFLPAYGYHSVYYTGLPFHKGRDGTYWSSIGVNETSAYWISFVEEGTILFFDLDDNFEPA